MTYDEFIGKVQSRGRMASSGEAVAAIRATLETFSQRLMGGAPNNLASQLPEEIGIYMQGPQSGLGEPMPLKQLYEVISLRERRDLPQAIFHARAVMSVVQEAVSEGVIRKILDQLPSEYDQLFELTGQVSES